LSPCIIRVDDFDFSRQGVITVTRTLPRLPHDDELEEIIMAGYTDEVDDECGKDVVFAVDVLDVDRHLQTEHVSLDETLSDCGCGPQKCSYLQAWVNKRRSKAGRERLAPGTIEPATTIREVIAHVC
jgi:hypothetical protein